MKPSRKLVWSDTINDAGEIEYEAKSKTKETPGFRPMKWRVTAVDQEGRIMWSIGKSDADLLGWRPNGGVFLSEDSAKSYCQKTEDKL